jgi:hypothetical protein
VSEPRRTGGRGLRLFCGALLLAAAALACAASEPEDGGSETHFLTPCEEDVDCEAFAEPHVCHAGYCRPEDEVPETNACTEPLTQPNDVLIFGDSVLELSEFSTCVEARAVTEALLAADAHYRDSASALTSFLSETNLNFSLHTQYADALAGGPVRLVIMNGGATDMLQLSCPTPVADDCPAVQAAVDGAEQLFLRMADDGVERIVYLFYPDPLDNEPFRAGLDVLRPLLEARCADSPVPCLWVDLRSTFAGNADYYGSDGIVFSQTGACAATDTLWTALEERCP